MPEEKLTACDECDHHFCIMINDWCDHGPKKWDPMTATDRRVAVLCQKKNTDGHCPDFTPKQGIANDKSS